MKIGFIIPLTQSFMRSSANTSLHWTEKMKWVKRQRDIMCIYYKKATYEYKPTLPCTVKMIRIAPRSLDFVNLVYSFKHYQDELSDRLIPGLAWGRADGDERIKWEFNQEKGNPKEYAIKIEIEFI